MKWDGSFILWGGGLMVALVAGRGRGRCEAGFQDFTSQMACVYVKNRRKLSSG